MKKIKHLHLKGKQDDKLCCCCFISLFKAPLKTLGQRKAKHICFRNSAQHLSQIKTCFDDQKKNKYSRSPNIILIIRHFMPVKASKLSVLVDFSEVIWLYQLLLF